MQLNLDIESFFSFLFLLKDAGSSFSFQYQKKKKNGGRLIADQNSPPVNAAHCFSDKKNETLITG